MSRKCDICGKGLIFGNKVSHSNNKTRRSWKPNLQKVRALIGKTPTTVRICTRCLRSGKIQKAV